MAELIAAVDLMRMGYEVFRAISPDCRCDLAVVKDNRLLRIQARTGHRNEDGTIAFPKKNTDAGRHDHYAVVLHGEAVVYIPPLEALGALAVGS